MTISATDDVTTARPAAAARTVDARKIYGKAQTEVRDRIGFIFQAYNLVPTLPAGDNVTLPLRLAGRVLRLGAGQGPW